MTVPPFSWTVFVCSYRHPNDLKRLRWVTVGYHHDWNTKVYSENRRGCFPDELRRLFNYLASVLGFGENFDAQAAIVNYYPWDATLSPHTDHSEINFEAPLFSLRYVLKFIKFVLRYACEWKHPLFLRSNRNQGVMDYGHKYWEISNDSCLYEKTWVSMDRASINHSLFHRIPVFTSLINGTSRRKIISYSLGACHNSIPLL